MTRFHPRILAPPQKRLARVLGPWATARGFYLAGGTALALHLGHRESVDFDWFGPKDFTPRPLINEIERLVGSEMEVDASEAGTIVGRIGGVSVSLFRYRYPLLGALAEWAGMALASLPDLAAMKLAAVSDRSAKRDFVDVHELLGSYALAEMVAFFAAKYPASSVGHVLRALTYFVKADRQKMPRMFRDLTWADLKRELRRSVDEVLRDGQGS